MTVRGLTAAAKKKENALKSDTENALLINLRLQKCCKCLNSEATKLSLVRNSYIILIKTKT